MKTLFFVLLFAISQFGHSQPSSPVSTVPSDARCYTTALSFPLSGNYNPTLVRLKLKYPTQTDYYAEPNIGSDITYCVDDLKSTDSKKKTCCNNNLLSNALKGQFSAWNLGQNSNFKDLQTKIDELVIPNINRLKLKAKNIMDKYRGADQIDDLQKQALFYAENVDFVLTDYFKSADYSLLKGEYENLYSQASPATTPLRTQCLNSLLHFRQSALCKICFADNSDMVDSTTSRLKIASNTCMTLTESCKKIWRHRFHVI